MLKPTESSATRDARLKMSRGSDAQATYPTTSAEGDEEVRGERRCAVLGAVEPEERVDEGLHDRERGLERDADSR